MDGVCEVLTLGLEDLLIFVELELELFCLGLSVLELLS